MLDDPDETIQWSGPLVVLTSRVTASAAEILAGAVKDYRRGVIVGDDHTFGKGSVQTVAPLPPGLGALKLTTALFYRPGGKSTQQIGVPADIVVPALTANDELGETNQPYSLPARSIEAFANGTPKQSGGFIADRRRHACSRSRSARTIASPATRASPTSRRSSRSSAPTTAS